MPKQARWHEKVKQALKEIGKERGYNVSESEKEMVLAAKFKMFDFKIKTYGSQRYELDIEKRKPHTFSIKPDGVWKKGHIYRAIFEVEYLKASNSQKPMGKRKYSIGSFMLSYLAMIQKSIKYTAFITNNENLYREIVTFKHLIPLKHRKNTYTLCLKASDQPSIKQGLEETFVKEWKI